MTSLTHILGLTLKRKFILSATVNRSLFLSLTWRRCPSVGDWSWDVPAAPSVVQKNSCRCRLGSGAECPQWCSVAKPACWSWGGILPSVVQRTAPPLFPQHLKKQNSKTFLLKQRLSSSKHTDQILRCPSLFLTLCGPSCLGQAREGQPGLSGLQTVVTAQETWL